MDDIFVAPPGWSWDIVLYFFFGGLAGGAYFTASLLRLVDRDRRDWPLSRIGYYLAFPLVVVCALLLIKDLGVPERFWHMIFKSEEFPGLMFKGWSPISFGTWIVSLFGALALLSFLHALVEGRVWSRERIARFTRPLHEPRGLLGIGFLLLTALSGLLLAGYTGLLVMVTNAPTWSHDPLIPPMFMASGVATGAAAIFLLGHASRLGGHAGRHNVLRLAAMALAFEAVLVLASALLGIGTVAPYYLGAWALLFWAVILPLGLLAPVVLLLLSEFRGRHLVGNAPVVGAVLLLTGGFLMRLFEVFGGQAYFVPYFPFYPM